MNCLAQSFILMHSYCFLTESICRRAAWRRARPRCYFHMGACPLSFPFEDPEMLYSGTSVCKLISRRVLYNTGASQGILIDVGS